MGAAVAQDAAGPFRPRDGLGEGQGAAAAAGDKARATRRGVGKGVRVKRGRRIRGGESGHLIISCGYS